MSTLKNIGELEVLSIAIVASEGIDISNPQTVARIAHNVALNKVRDEAIKWIKKFRSECYCNTKNLKDLPDVMELCHEYNCIQQFEKIWMRFFNLSEEDLK